VSFDPVLWNVQLFYCRCSDINVHTDCKRLVAETRRAHLKIYLLVMECTGVKKPMLSIISAKSFVHIVVYLVCIFTNYTQEARSVT
jgi:hypothetical protein